MSFREQANESLDPLLDEFIRRHLRGEVPDPVEYVRRAGKDGERLRDLLAVFLAETEPVLPTPAAARDLIERFEPRERFDPSRFLGELIDRWGTASSERRRDLLEALGSGRPSLDLALGVSRSRIAERGRVERIQLDHPGGARVEVAEDGLVTLEVYGLPESFVGTALLVAFPSLGATGALSPIGEELALRQGLLLAPEPVGVERELSLEIGRLEGDERPTASDLAEIRIIAIGEGVEVST
jgi:hypothetical protein